MTTNKISNLLMKPKAASKVEEVDKIQRKATVEDLAKAVVSGEVEAEVRVLLIVRNSL